MNGSERSTQDLAHIAAEHRELERHARQLFQLVRRPIETCGLRTALTQLTMHLQELQDLLRRHITQEAAGGYLEEAVARMSRLAADADAIERQHPDLLREVSELVDMATKATPGLDVWKNAAAAVVVFIDRLSAHETNESRILQQGFNEDPAVLDLETNR